MHTYEVRPHKDHRGVNLISDALPFGWLWYAEPNAITKAIGYAKFDRRSHDAVIRSYDEAGQRDRNAQARGRFQGGGEVCSGQVTNAIKTAFSACSSRGLVAKTVATK
jgi:hypothetical protein